ncbi:glycolipid transfer protein domain-containing protein [Hysterangium stoloniferum]|nr:glycolipid transfer protein domain-containing protein [Hysterangium stoloniferum]
MSTYFDTIKKSFADVPITDAGVDTVAFLEAAEGLVGLFDLLGSTAFGVVQSDLKGNIAKVRTRYNATPELSATLEQLVLNEKKEKKQPATEGLMWLLRGLAFTAQALQRSHGDKSEELSVSFNKSYEGTLKQFHNFVVKGVFALAMKACPYRKDFYEKLGSPPEKVDQELGVWLAALDVILKRMNTFYVNGKYGTVY